MADPSVAPQSLRQEEPGAPAGPPALDGRSAGLWVFGYGSLMWRPGFPFLEQRRAVVRGFHRALCIYSHVHRGTADRPGLVLGLDRGGSCLGLAFRVAAGDATETIAYLRAREQATAVYVERHVRVTFPDGESATALTYVADRRHPQYAGRLSDAEVVRLVRQGIGQSGRNPEYVRNTHRHLIDLGVHDPLLTRLVAALDEEP
ncbi:gamma-glutamylcyclotransferase [Chelatococcus sp. GCM10030263]|uniref:gamma-glutamylcyclotransferase n=1 Tax=Chelatococcus sp. GCM10030263 TaxID=3273387 RepID=UPI0036129A82